MVSNYGHCSHNCRSKISPTSGDFGLWSSMVSLLSSSSAYGRAELLRTKITGCLLHISFFRILKLLCYFGTCFLPNFLTIFFAEFFDKFFLTIFLTNFLTKVLANTLTNFLTNFLMNFLFDEFF